MGVAAAVVIAVLVNVLAARHYWRWDWTSQGLYTLSAVTKKTLSSLSEPLEIYVLLSTSDPLNLTVRHLLDAYQSHTTQLRIHFVDPDASPAEFFALQKKHGIVAGRTEGGRVVADAAVLVVRGERRHFLTADELVAVVSGQEMRARPQVEQMLSGAIKQVLVSDPIDICVTSGHGERSLEEGGNEGLLALRVRLERNNFRPVTLPPLRALKAARDPIGGCKAVVVAGPQQPLDKAEVRRLKLYFETGGNLLVASGPVPDEVGEGYLDLGLGPLLAAVGLRQHRNFVFERDGARRAPDSHGEVFTAVLREHPITTALMNVAGLPVVLTVASSLEILAAAPSKPTALLATTKSSFGMKDFVAWAQRGGAPTAQADDRKGPLVVAYALELPKLREQDAHGSRAVVIGSSSMIYGGNWLNRQLQGSALFMEGAISWLASEPVVLDIPAKKARIVGLRITQEVLQSFLLKVVVGIPLLPLFIGIAVRLRRRGDAKPKKRTSDEPPDNGDNDEGKPPKRRKNPGTAAKSKGRRNKKTRKQKKDQGAPE